MRFNITQVLTPVPNEHVLNGTYEVMETFHWGLTQLGHQVTAQTNTIAADAINIIFGYQMLDEKQIASLPPNSIIYNLEDLEVTPLERRKRSIFYSAENLHVWDFYEGNITAWKQHKLKYEPVLVPIGYAPTLRRIPVRNDGMIDVLFYGFPAPPRMEIVRHVAQHGIRTVYACGLYGQVRDDLIAHSKIVLNLNKGTEGKIFEVIRIAYLLANSKPVVSDVYPDSRVPADLREAIAFAPREEITRTCMQLLGDDAGRAALGERGFQIFSRRDIRAILANAIEKSGLA